MGPCRFRASELLRTLPAEKQSIALAKLSQGLQSGKVKNASAYIVGVVNGPDLLDIDERASELLKELPPNLRKQVIEKLKKAADVRNPSAWIAKAVISAKKEQPSFRFGGGGSLGPAGLDEGATRLLHSLPNGTQQEILGKLMMQQSVKNPSGWVVKACLEAGATPRTPTNGGGGLGSAALGNPAELYDDFDPQVFGTLMAGPAGPIALDEGARTLLASLPVDKQMEICTNLVSQADVKNPSGWVVKSCMAAGAKGNGPNAGGMQMASPYLPRSFSGGGFGQAQAAGLDQGALDMLKNLPHPTQQEIMSKLAAANPTNPSAWVVKSCLAANAPGGGGGAAGRAFGAGAAGGFQGRGTMGRGPSGPARLPPGISVDPQAQQLLRSLPMTEQQDIVMKLTNSWNEGKVANPSAWVAKASLKAGAKSTPGMGRASPY